MRMSLALVLLLLSACAPLYVGSEAMEVAPALPGISGTLDAFGYQPPDGVPVFWRTFSGDVVRRLNASALWSGSNSDDQGYLARYAEGRRDVLGRWIASQGVESQGGMSFLILQALFRQVGLSRDPGAREVLDFGIVHGGQRQLGCADFVRLVGRQEPGCRDVPPDKGLRLQPTEPPGCCKNFLPCAVEQPGRRLGEVWTEPVQTPQGGRRGCTLINTKGEEPPPPPPPPTCCPCPETEAELQCGP